MSSSTVNVASIVDGLRERDLYHSFGETIPNLASYDAVSFWGAGIYAAKLQHIKMFTSLSSPGPEWMANIPAELAGRKVISGTVDSLPDEGTYFVKPSEAKILSLPAKEYEVSEVKRILSDNNFDSSIQLQWTADVLKVDREHRFFVADRQIATGSPYNVEGVVGYDKRISREYLTDARSFAQEALQELGSYQPQAFTLDVGMNMMTGSWFIVEANRAWSSGFYHSDPATALEVVEYSCQATKPEWLWVPDKHVIDLVAGMGELIVSDTAESSGYVKYSKN